MKTLIKPFVYIMSALMVLSFASCNDFLDKEPEGKVPEEKVDYTNLSNMYQPVSGVYAKIRTSGLHWVIWEITTIRDQDVFSGQWNGSDYYNLSEYKYNDSFWGINELWMQYYNIIKTANAAIESLDLYAENITNDDDMKTYKQYRGEVMFMRAYAYYRLVQAFGAVTILRDNNQTDLSRSTVNAVYKYALEDLQYGMDNMPRIRPNQRSDLNLCISIKMLSNSVQIELFIILWVTKLIHNKQPMYAVLDKDTIKNEILPHLSVAKRGFQSKSSLIEVINAILYKLKTGCQWEYLPVKELFSGKVLKYGAVFHHYNKWSKKGEWKSLWLQLLDKHRSELDMSSVDLDGSHTPAIRGGEEVGYQGRKKRKTTNALYLTDRKGLPLAMSVPKSGEHHDTHNIVAVMQNMMEDMAKANIRTDGLFLNADAGFDCAALRSVLKSYGIVSNICINKRNGTTNDSIVLDELLYRERYSIERTNAWMDSFRTILNRFDTTLRNWESWNYIAFSVMLLRKCARKRKV